jgi:hypothetical protein
VAVRSAHVFYSFRPGLSPGRGSSSVRCRVESHRAREAPVEVRLRSVENRSWDFVGLGWLSTGDAALAASAAARAREHRETARSAAQDHDDI